MKTMREYTAQDEIKELVEADIAARCQITETMKRVAMILARRQDAFEAEIRKSL